MFLFEMMGHPNSTLMELRIGPLEGAEWPTSPPMRVHATLQGQSIVLHNIHFCMSPEGYGMCVYATLTWLCYCNACCCLLVAFSCCILLLACCCCQQLSCLAELCLLAASASCSLLPVLPVFRTPSLPLLHLNESSIHSAVPSCVVTVGGKV